MITPYFIYRAGSDEFVSDNAQYRDGAGPSHGVELTNYLEDYHQSCSMCDAISTLHHDNSLYSVTAHQGLYEVRRK